MSSLDAVLDEVEAALDRAHAVPLLCQRPAEVAQWVSRLQAVRARVDALCCAGLVAAGTLDVAGLSGTRNVASVVAANTSADPRVVRADLGLGVWLEGFVVFSEAFAAGVLTRRHVEALRRVENTRTSAHLADAQSYLVEAAATCDWREFNQVLRYWELAFDPDGAEPNDQMAKRFFHITKRRDGMVDGRFRLDPVAGQAVLSALDQEDQRLFRADSEVSTPTLRTPTQRRADALVNLASRGATRPDGAVPAPLVHVVFGAEVLAGIADERGPASALDARQPEGRCELVDGTPLHPNAALAALAAAEVRRIVLATASETLDLGRAVRSFPAKLKQALLVVARGRCADAGCDAPFGWLQADHIHPWHHDGPTALTNGQILCDPHNKIKRDRTDHRPKLE